MTSHLHAVLPLIPSPDVAALSGDISPYMVLVCLKPVSGETSPTGQAKE